MATTTIHINCRPGTTDVYATSVGGSGTAAASYTPTQLAGYLHKIDVTEALTGNWYFGAGNAAGDRGYRTVYGLTDTAETFELTADIATSVKSQIDPNDYLDTSVSSRSSHTPSQVRSEMDSNSTRLSSIDTAIYHADVNFVRDASNDQDEYVVTWYKNGIKVTDASSVTLTVVAAHDGSTLIGGESMSEIGSTDNFKYFAPSAKRQTIGNIYIVSSSATIDGSSREFSWVLGRDSG